MRKCKINFKSLVDGQEYAFQTLGTTTEEDNVVTVKYQEFAGEDILDSVLTINDVASVEVVRKGVYSSSIKFIKEKIADGVSSSPFGQVVSKINTKYLYIKKIDDIIKISARYKILNSGSDNSNTVNISVHIFK